MAIFLLLASCNIKVYTLLDKVTNVPKNNEVFSNKTKFNSTLLQFVDTGTIYEEFDRNKNVLMRFDNCVECRSYNAFKFYSNGCFNLFYFKTGSSLSMNEFDPLYAGLRGVYYLENNKVK